MPTADEERPVTAGRGEKARRRPQCCTRSRRGSTRFPADAPPQASDPKATGSPTPADGEQARHAGLMRMLAVIRDRLAPGISPVQLYRAADLAGINANPETASLEPGMKALNADQDAQALLEVASDDPGVS